MWAKIMICIGVIGLLIGCTAQVAELSDTDEPSEQPPTEVATETPILPTATLEPSLTPIPAIPTDSPGLINAPKIQPCYIIPFSQIEPLVGAVPLYPPTGTASGDPESDVVEAGCFIDGVAIMSISMPFSSQRVRDVYESRTGESVDGLGDQAIWDGTWLYVVSGDVLLGITPNMGAVGDEALAAARKLAEVAVDRLDSAVNGDAVPFVLPDAADCGFITVDEVEAIVGTQVSDPLYSGSYGEIMGDYRTCDFYGSENSASITHSHYPTVDGARWQYDNQTWLGGEALTYGNAAMWVANPDGSPGHRLVILKGSEVISIAVFTMLMDDDQTARDFAMQLAELVVNRIP